MTCRLFDLGCHLQSGWESLGLLNQALIAGGLLAIVLGSAWSLLQLLKRLGGWPALAGGIAVVVGLVLAVLPRKPKGRQPDPEPVEHEEWPEDAFGFPRPPKDALPKKPKSLLERLTGRPD